MCRIKSLSIFFLQPLQMIITRLCFRYILLCIYKFRSILYTTYGIGRHYVPLGSIISVLLHYNSTWLQYTIHLAQHSFVSLCLSWFCEHSSGRHGCMCSLYLWRGRHLLWLPHKKNILVDLLAHYIQEGSKPTNLRPGEVCIQNVWWNLFLSKREVLDGTLV